MNPPEWHRPPAAPPLPVPPAPAGPVGRPPLPGPPMPGPPMPGPPMPGAPMPGPPMPGGPGFPPPRANGGGGGPLVPLLIIGSVAVLAVVGVLAFLVLGDDDKKSTTISMPSATRLPLSGTTGLPSVEPSPTSTSGGRTSDPAGLLTPTVRTARGNTFTRAGTRVGTCASRANAKLVPVLRANPCVGTMQSAVYANSSRTIITVISILKFSDSTSANAVSRATNQSGWPKLLTPSDASGLPQLSREPGYWTRTWSRGSNVIYAQSYRASGGASGDRTGLVYTTAGELGVEITNAMLFTD